MLFSIAQRYYQLSHHDMTKNTTIDSLHVGFLILLSQGGFKGLRQPRQAQLVQATAFLFPLQPHCNDSVVLSGPQARTTLLLHVTRCPLGYRQLLTSFSPLTSLDYPFPFLLVGEHCVLDSFWRDLLYRLTFYS